MVIGTSLTGRLRMTVRFYEAFRISQRKELYSGNSINRKGGGTPMQEAESLRDSLSEQSLARGGATPELGEEPAQPPALCPDHGTISLRAPDGNKIKSKEAL